MDDRASFYKTGLVSDQKNVDYIKSQSITRKWHLNTNFIEGKMTSSRILHLSVLCVRMQIMLNVNEGKSAASLSQNYIVLEITSKFNLHQIVDYTLHYSAICLKVKLHYSRNYIIMEFAWNCKLHISANYIKAQVALKQNYVKSEITSKCNSYQIVDCTKVNIKLQR